MIQVQDNNLRINSQENNLSPYNDKINYQKAMILLDDNCLDKAWKYIKNIDTDVLKEKMGITNINHYALNNIKDEIKFSRYRSYKGCDGSIVTEEVDDGGGNGGGGGGGGEICACICCYICGSLWCRDWCWPCEVCSCACQVICSDDPLKTIAQNCCCGSDYCCGCS